MVFGARQLVKKARKHLADLFILYVDFKESI